MARLIANIHTNAHKNNHLIEFTGNPTLTFDTNFIKNGKMIWLVGEKVRNLHNLG